MEFLINVKRDLLKMVLVAIIVTMTFQSITKAPFDETQNQQILDLQVINKANQEPISNVELGIRIDRERRKEKTDSEGRCRIILGKDTPVYLRVEVKKEGFVPIRLNWRKGPGRPKVPDQYTLALERGTSIGGIIQDEQGEPIEGVSVFLLVPAGNAVERVAIWDHVVKTDAEGRWQCDIVPFELNDIRIRLVHKEHISDGAYGATPRPSIEELRVMTGVMTMKQWFTVSGHVFDANDQPIEGASVARNSDHQDTTYPSTDTDGKGYFEFTKIRAGEMLLTVQAKGYSPDLLYFTVHKGMEPLEFSLEPGHTIKGRIMDSKGQPIAGASVAVDTWRGHLSLSWSVETDAEGRFEWNEAPVDEVLINISKKDYMSVSNYGMSPSEKEYEITLPDILKVNGKVVDSETGEPIPEFKLLSGIDFGGEGSVSWSQRRAKTYTNGHYETSFTYPYPAHLIRIEANGYKPAISRSIDSNEGEVTINFTLEKGMGPSGLVLLPDGSPAAGAEVILCTPSQGGYIRNGRNRQKRDKSCVETNKDGKFAFSEQQETYVFVILHDEGYAEVSDSELAESPEVTLQPWATVTGKILIGKNPGTNEKVRLGFERPYDRSQPMIYFDYEAATDSDGTFVFDRVRPGKANVSRLIQINDRTSRYSQSVSVVAKAGEKVSITIGGTGRPVTGKVKIPTYLKDKFNWQHTDYGLRVDSSEGPYGQLGFKIQEDGTFRIDDVPAGDYHLYVNAYGPPANPRGFRGEMIAILSQYFNVPEMPNGRSDEPLDLGIPELAVIGKSDYAPSLVGKPLPDLAGIKSDFTPAQAKDNKMILVCLFDMNQRPSRHYINQLKQRAKLLEDKGIFIFAIQTSKIEESVLEEWVKKSNVSFFVGRIVGDEEKKRFSWGVKSLPWLILTDAEHIIRAEGFNLNELEEKVREIKE